VAEIRLRSAPSQNGADALGRRSILWSMVGLGMLVVIGLAGVLALRQVNESDYWVDHTREVITANQQLLSDVKDAESAERGYIITGEDRYLEPYNSAAQDIARRQSELVNLTADNARQQERVQILASLIAQRMAVLTKAVQQRREKGFDAAQQVVASGQGLAVMKAIRDTSQEIEKEEYGLLRERAQTRQARLRSGFSVTLVAALLALIALILAPLDVRRAVKLRDLAQQEKEESELTTQALFQSAAQAILMVGSDGRIVMANRATEKLFGYTGDELLGQNVDALVPESLRGGHKQNRDQYFKNPQSRPMGLGMDLLARRKDGSEFFVEISLSFIHSSRETLGVAFVSDISKRRADEQAIRQQREDLRMLTGRLMTAQDDERRRVARDLHDDLSQKLAFLAMDIGKLATKPSAGEFVGDLRPLQLRAADAAESVRRISHQLHPSILDDIGLEAALEQYCEDFQQRSGITTHFTSQNVPEALNPEIASSLYHIAQECLRNVSKHANTQVAFVSLESVGNVLCLTVKDSGIGLAEKQPARGSGIGFVAMKERAHLVNGNVSIQSRTGEGTEVRVEVPIATAV
jgi:PAS domain S-box-containing protein